MVRPCLKSKSFLFLPSRPLCCLQVSATDEDRGSFGAISYSLSSGTGSSPPSLFAIDKESGQLCTRATLDRDEGLDKFDLVVTATDGVGRYWGLKFKGWKSFIQRSLLVCMCEKHVVQKRKCFGRFVHPPCQTIHMGLKLLSAPYNTMVPQPAGRISLAREPGGCKARLTQLWADSLLYSAASL